jgi:ribosomal protein S21
MTRIHVGLMGICSNYHEHKIYEKNGLKTKRNINPKIKYRNQTKP